MDIERVEGIDMPIIFRWINGKLRAFEGVDDVSTKLSIKFSPRHEDVTAKYLANKPSGIPIVKEGTFVNHGRKKYFVDGKNVKLEISESERADAEWLKNTFGGTIIHQPRILIPENKKTADYYCSFLKDTLEQKLMGGSNAERIAWRIKDAFGQSKNVLLNISNSSVSFSTGKEVIGKLFFDPEFGWLELVIFRKGNNYVVFTRKK